MTNPAPHLNPVASAPMVRIVTTTVVQPATPSSSEVTIAYSQYVPGFYAHHEAAQSSLTPSQTPSPSR